MNHSFDWEQFTKDLKARLPDPDREIAKLPEMDLTWIEKYVQDALKRAFSAKPPATFTPQKNDYKKKKASPKKSASHNKDRAFTSHYRTELDELKTEVLELFRHVVVKVYVPEHLNPRRIRVASSSDRIRVQVVPHQKVQIIPLPHRVNPGQAKSVYQNGWIEIHLPKNEEAETYKEIHIHWKE